MSDLAKWYDLTPSMRILVIQMTMLLLLLRVGLKIFKLSTIRRWFNWIASRFPSPTGSENYQESVIWAATVIGRRVLGEGPCLAQALAVQILLSRKQLHTELCIGVAKDGSGNLVAHAWVEKDGQIVIGGSEQELKRYTPLPDLDRKLA